MGVCAWRGVCVRCVCAWRVCGVGMACACRKIMLRFARPRIYVLGIMPQNIYYVLR